MTRDEAAAALNGNEYREEGSRALWASMKEAGLVAVFGASDDLMEFRGAIDDEVGAWNGVTREVDRKGLIPTRPECDTDAELQDYFARKDGGAKVKANWDRDGYSWIIDTKIPHAKFNIVEDDEMYCSGVVFALADIPTTERPD